MHEHQACCDPMAALPQDSPLIAEHAHTCAKQKVCGAEGPPCRWGRWGTAGFPCREKGRVSIHPSALAVGHSAVRNLRLPHHSS